MSGRDRMILAITQEGKLRILLEREFAGTGYEVAGASSASLGRARLLLDRPDLVICDATADGPGGVEEFRAVVEAAQAQATPFLMITPWRDLLFRRHHFVHHGAVRRAVIFRPFDESALIEEVRHLILGCQGEGWSLVCK